MMAKILISVIVPVYNVSAYLDRCVKSILDQTYENIEIILVDDGSTDDSSIICDKYAQMDKRIKVVHKTNGGLVTARKAGLACACGEYIGFVDSDDYIAPDFYELLLKSLLENESDISQIGYIMQYKDKKKTISCSRKTVNIDSCRMDVLCDGLLKRRKQDICIFFNVWSKLYKAELLKFCYSNVPDKQQYGEDVICTCLCMLYCNNISTIDDEKYYYTVRDDSISNEKNLNFFVKVSNLYVQLQNMFRHHVQYFRIKDAIDYFYKNRILLGLDMIGIEVNRYVFPKMEMLINKNIILYGAGRVGRDYYAQLCRYKSCNLIAFIDKNSEKYHFDYIDVMKKEQLSGLEYDLILVSVLREDIADAIKADLIKSGVQEEKIVWETPVSIY